MKPLGTATGMVVLLMGLVACTEAPQGAPTSKAADRPAWDSAQSAYTAAGYQHSDRAAWDQQMRTRAQSQNEYTRTP